MRAPRAALPQNYSRWEIHAQSRKGARTERAFHLFAAQLKDERPRQFGREDMPGGAQVDNGRLTLGRLTELCASQEISILVSATSEISTIVFEPCEVCLRTAVIVLAE